MVKSVPSESHSLVKSVPSGDYLISTPAAGRSASFISESLRTAPWHITEMAACPRGHIAACELQQKLLIITCNSCQYQPAEPRSASPRSARSVFQQEVADPAVTQYLMVSGAQIPYLICYVCSTKRSHGSIKRFLGCHFRV